MDSWRDIFKEVAVEARNCCILENKVDVERKRLSNMCLKRYNIIDGMKNPEDNPDIF